MSKHNWNQFGKTPVPMKTGNSNRDAGILIDSLQVQFAEVLAAGKEASDCFLSEVARNMVLTNLLNEAVELLRKIIKVRPIDEGDRKYWSGRITDFLTRQEASSPLSRPSDPCCEFKDRTACSAPRKCKQCEHDTEDL